MWIAPANWEVPQLELHDCHAEEPPTPIHAGTRDQERDMASLESNGIAFPTSMTLRFPPSIGDEHGIRANPLGYTLQMAEKIV